MLGAFSLNIIYGPIKPNNNKNKNKNLFNEGNMIYW